MTRISTQPPMQLMQSKRMQSIPFALGAVDIRCQQPKGEAELANFRFFVTKGASQFYFFSDKGGRGVRHLQTCLSKSE